MDKYEYQVCTEQIKQLISEKRFAEAMEIADTIDWRRVRSVSMLITVSEIYKVNKRYEDARDILLLAYEKHPTGKDIVYALCELAIKINDIVQAIECYKEFCALAPDDPNSCILLYKIYKAQDVSLEEQIDVLEEFKSKEYIEKWAYELASLYHKTGQEAKCVAACDELILWFGEGKYVRKAMELKMQHEALTPDQQAKYDGRAVTGSMPVFKQPYQNESQFGNNARQTGPMINQYAEYIQQTGDIYSTGQMPEGTQYAGAQQGFPQGQMYDQPVTITPDQYNMQYGQAVVSPEMNHLGMTQNIMVQSMGTGVWNTTDLQAQLAPQVMEVMSQDVNGGIYGADGQVYYNVPDNVPNGPIQGLPDEVGGFANAPGGVGGNMPEAEAVAAEKEAPAADVNMAVADDKDAAEAEKTDAADDKAADKEPEKPAISVHTGVIDLSSTDLPVQDIPKNQETSDIMSKLAGVIPGTNNSSVSVKGIEKPEEKSAEKDDEKPEVSHGGHSVLTDTNERVEITPNGNKKAVQEEVKVPEEKPEEAAPDKAEAKPESENTPVSESKETSDDTDKYEVSEEIRRINNKAFGSKSSEETPEDISAKVKAEAAVKATEAKEKKLKEVVPVSDEKGQYPYDTVTDIGCVEEIPEIEQPDDIDDMLKTRDLPVDQINAYEMDSMPEVDEYEVDDNDDTPQFMRKNIRASREFDDDEYRIFCRYDGMEAMKAQLVSAMDLMSMESSHGNIAIMGPESADCKGIAINIVKAMQSKNPEFSGKVAKISGEALNKKDIKGTLKKLENGALIVEGAGGLTKESVLILTGVLTDEPEKVLVIIEGLKENIKPLFSYTKQMKSVFDARIDIADFTDDDLVNYGRGYALEKEYFIDDMGGLALHNRISEMQTYDHKVTVDEVRELVDSAIKHVDKKNMGHFMDMLLGRRYDDEDNIILSEKDFEF